MANIQSMLTYNANLSPAQAQIKALTGQIGALSAAFNTLDKSALKAQGSLAAAFSTNIGQIGGFTTQTVRAHSAVESFGKQLAANKLTMREYFREAITGYTRQNSMLKQLAAQQVKYQQSIMVPTGAGQAMMLTPTNLAATGTAAAMASQKFSIFNELINGGANKLLNFGKNTQWAGRQLMVGFTVPLMMFTAVMSKQFRDLDKELTRFQKVYGSELGNSISDSTARMRDQVEQLAYTISRTYGIAAKDTAALAADIAATGQEGQALIDSIQQTTRLSVLGEVDRQEAMKATLAIQSAFKQDTNELAESINFLNAVENQTSTTLQDLSTAIPKVGPVVRSLGGDIEDLATLLVAMREGGIPAAEAANALKSGLASLINPTKQASEVAKKFGVDLVGIVEANKGQLMPTIYGVQEALSGLDSFSRSKVIEQIFGKYQFARMTALFDNIGKTGSQTQTVLELAAKSSSDLAAIANGEIKTLTESTNVKFMRSLEDLKNSLMPLAETLTKTLIPIFEVIGKGIRMFSDFFQALPEPVKNFAKYGAAITALAGPVIMLVGLFGNLIANGLKFGMMMTRIGARIAGLKIEKFELLNADVMAAKFGVDNLTKSFDTQEAALIRLTGVLSQYEASLKRLTSSQPGLFIPGAIPGRGGQVPIRRQTGSQSPERVPGGYGGGDRIPALLEPGESVITKEATAKFWPVIEAMNRGNLPGFNRGALFLGMPRGYKDLQGAKQVRQTLSSTNVEATTGRFAQLPVTDVGTKVTSIGGRSSSIPGVNGVYEQGGKKYVVKTHDTADSALAEVRGTQLTRDVFGLDTPVQELIKIKHPVTGDVIFAVRSPYEAKFASSTGVIDEKNFFGQALAAIVRRDKDLQPDNLYGNIVTDVGQAFVANKASQPRIIGGELPGVAEQTATNFLMSKGGAKKWFAETTAVMAKTMSEDDYVRGFQTTIAAAAKKARGAIDNLPYMTKEERAMYGRIINDLDEAAKIDWRAVYQFHRGITPEIKRPPTAAALAKKEAQEAEKARQRGQMAGWEYGLPYRFQSGGKVPGGYGGGDKVPALLEPGEMVVRKEAAAKYAPVIVAMNRGNIQKLQSGSLDIQASHTAMPFAENTKQYAAALTLLGSSVRYGKDFIEFAKTFPEAIKVVSRSVALLPSQMNQALKSGMLQKDFISGWDKVGAGKFAAAAIGGGFDIRQQGATQALKEFETAVKKEAVRLAKSTKDKKVTDQILARAQRNIINEYKQSADSQDPVQIASKNLASAIEKQALRLGAVRILASDEMIARNPNKFKTDANGTTYFGSLPVRREGGRDVRYNIPARLSGGIDDPTAAQKSVAQRLGFSTSILSPFLTSSGGRVGTPERGTGGTGYLTTKSSLKLLEREASKLGNNVSSKFIIAFIQALRTNFQSASPSRRMETEVSREGKNFGDGAAQGFIKGYKSSAAGKPIIAGPVGGGGIESISNAQKIAQADQTILKYKEMQAKFTSQRSIAEQQIANLNAEIYKLDEQFKKGQIKLVEWQQKRTALKAEIVKFDSELKDASSKEKMYQDRINAAQQRRADALEKVASQQSTPGYAWGAGGVPADRKAMAAARRIQAGYERPGDRQLASQFFAMPTQASVDRTGPTANLKETRESIPGMRGQNAMNAMFMVSMLVSSFSMVTGASEDLAGKLGLLSTAVMGASTAMMMFQGKNVTGNFLGLGSAGAAISNMAYNRVPAPYAPTAEGAAAAKQAGVLSKGAKGLMGLGSTLSMLGGPWGMAAATAIAGVTAAFILMRNAAEEARQRSVAAFSDPVKSAEYFGKSIKDVTQQMQDIQTSMSEQELKGIDQNLRDAVKQDYAQLIERIKYGGAEAGARELSLAFNKMIASGLSKEDATAAVKAIAVESGQVGGAAFAEAYQQGMLSASTPAEVAKNLASMYTPEAMKKAADANKKMLEEYSTNLFSDFAAQSIAPNIDNILGDIMSFGVDLPVGRLGIFGWNPGINREDLDLAADYGRSLGNIKEQLESSLDISADSLVNVTETLFTTFKEDPTATINSFNSIADAALSMGESFDTGPFKEFLSTIGGPQAIPLIQLIDSTEVLKGSAAAEQLTIDIARAVTAGMSLSDILDSLTSGTYQLDIAFNIRVAEAQKELNDLKQKFKEDIENQFSDDVERLDTRIGNLTNRITRLNEKRDEEIDKAEETYKAEQEASDAIVEGYQDQIDAQQDKIDANQDEIDSIQEKIDKDREAFDERMDSLEKEKDAIEESADSYIESLQKRSRADDFYAQQRQTSLSALGKLASGDVFGFLQERDKLSQQAQQFSYDEMISDIEDRRDLEVDAIDETMKKEQERQDAWEKAQQDRIDKIQEENDKIQDQIDIVQDQIDIEQELADQRSKDHEAEIEQINTTYETKIKNTEKELDNKRTQRTRIQEILDKAAEDEILTAEELAKTLGPIQAKQYIEEQKAILRSIFMTEYLTARKNNLDTEAAKAAAFNASIGMYNMMTGTPGEAGAQTVEGLISYLSIPAGEFAGAKPTGGVSSGPGTSTTTTTTENAPATDELGRPIAPPNGTTVVGNDGVTYVYDVGLGWSVVQEQRKTGGAIKYRGGGGKILGPGTGTSDSIPALLSNGEYVIRASSVAKYGKQFMDSVNRGQLQGFDGGGQAYKPTPSGSPEEHRNPYQPSNGQEVYEAKEHYGGSQNAPQQQYNDYVKNNPEKHARAVERGRKTTNFLNQQVRILRQYTATPFYITPPISYSAATINPLNSLFSPYMARNLGFDAPLNFKPNSFIGENEASRRGPRINDAFDVGKKFYEFLTKVSFKKYSDKELNEIIKTFGITNSKEIESLKKSMFYGMKMPMVPSTFNEGYNKEQLNASKYFKTLPKWMKELLINDPENYIRASTGLKPYREQSILAKRSFDAQMRQQELIQQIIYESAIKNQKNQSNNGVVARLLSQSMKEALLKQKVSQITQNVLGSTNQTNAPYRGGRYVYPLSNPQADGSLQDSAAMAGNFLWNAGRGIVASYAEMVGGFIDPQMVGNNPIADFIGGESYTSLSREEKALWSALSILDFIPGAILAKPFLMAGRGVRAAATGVRAGVGATARATAGMSMRSLDRLIGARQALRSSELGVDAMVKLGNFGNFTMNPLETLRAARIARRAKKYSTPSKTTKPPRRDIDPKFKGDPKTTDEALAILRGDLESDIPWTGPLEPPPWRSREIVEPSWMRGLSETTTRTRIRQPSEIDRIGNQEAFDRFMAEGPALSPTRAPLSSPGPSLSSPNIEQPLLGSSSSLKQTVSKSQSWIQQLFRTFSANKKWTHRADVNAYQKELNDLALELLTKNADNVNAANISLPGNLKIAKTESNVLPDNVLLQFLHDYVYKNVDVATVEKNILKNADKTPETKLLYFLSQKEFLSKIDNIHSKALNLPSINNSSVKLVDVYASQQIKDTQIAKILDEFLTPDEQLLLRRLGQYNNFDPKYIYDPSQYRNIRNVIMDGPAFDTGDIQISWARDIHGQDLINSLKTLAHESGHGVDRLLGLSGALEPTGRLQNTAREMARAEAFAESFNMNIMNDLYKNIDSLYRQKQIQKGLNDPGEVISSKKIEDVLGASERARDPYISGRNSRGRDYGFNTEFKKEFLQYRKYLYNNKLQTATPGLELFQRGGRNYRKPRLIKDLTMSRIADRIESRSSLRNIALKFIRSQESRDKWFPEMEVIIPPRSKIYGKKSSGPALNSPVYDYNAAQQHYFPSITSEIPSTTPSNYLNDTVDFSKGNAFWQADSEFNTKYFVSGSEVDSPGATVHVAKPKTVYSYLDDPKNSIIPEASIDSGIIGDIITSRAPGYSVDEITSSGMTRRVAGEGPEGQLSLFDINHSAPQITYLASHPDYKAYVLSLLANAVKTTTARFGEKPFADTSLSIHSAPIVDRFMNSGMVRIPSYRGFNDLHESSFTDFFVDSPMSPNLSGSRITQTPRALQAYFQALARSALRSTRPEGPIRFEMPFTGEIVEFKSKAELERFLEQFNRIPGFAGGGPVEMKNALQKWVKPENLAFFPNWENSGSWPGNIPRGIMMHHTAGVWDNDPGADQQAAYMGKGWYGVPVVQALVAKNGKTHILSYGGTGYGAGAGGTSGQYASDIWSDPQFEGLKNDLNNIGQASNILWQIETESWGESPDFTSEQFDSIARLSAAIREYSGWPSFSGKIINHKDWAAAAGPNRPNGQRVDTLYPISTFVNNAEQIWQAGGGATTGTSASDPAGATGGGTGTTGEPQTQTVTTISFGPGDLGPGDRFLASKLSLLGQRTVTTTTTTTGGTAGGTTSASGVTGGTGDTGGTPGAGGITLNPADYQDSVINGYKLVKLIYGTGWTNKDEVRTGYGVVMGESGGQRRNLRDYRSDMKGRDWGLWQINDYWHKSVNGEPIDFGERIFDAIYNSKIAFGIAKDPSSMQIWGSQWGSWNAFTNNTSEYQRGMSEFDANPEWWNQLVQETGGNARAGGGSIKGKGTSTSDSIPALLSNGEYVIRASSVNKYGKTFMDDLNAGKFATGGIVRPKRFGGGGIGRIFGNSKINQSSKTRATWPEDVENPYPEDEPFVGMPDDMYEEWLTYDFQMPYYETSFGFKVPLFWMVDPTGLYTSTGPGPDDWAFDGEEWAKRFKETIKEWTNIKPTWKKLWDKKPGGRAFANGGLVRPKRFGGGGINRIFGNSKINQSGPNRGIWPEDVENPYPEDEPFVGMPDAMYEEWLTYDFQMPYYETSFGFKVPLFWMVDPTGLYTSTGPGPDDWAFDGEEWAKRYKNTIKEWTDIKPTWKKLWDKKPGGRAFAEGGLVRAFRDGGIAEGNPDHKAQNKSGAGPRRDPDQMPSKKSLRIKRVIDAAIKYSGLDYSDQIDFPKDKAGNPLAWGCATSVAWLYKNKAGVTLPSMYGSMHQHAGLRKNVNPNEIMPGDLLFQYNPDPDSQANANPINHVEMFIRPPYDGKIITADGFIRGKIFNGGNGKGLQDITSYPIVSTGIKRVIGKPGKKLASGGFISGPGTSTSDSIPALLSDGEYVVRASSVAKYGKGFMDRVNSGQLGFADGGFVGSRMPTPSFNMPSMSMPQTNELINSVSNNYGGSVSNNSSNSSSVKIVVNAAQGQSTKAIANEVVKLINHSNSRRVHSRSI